MVGRMEPGESIFSTVLKEMMPELFTGNGIWANPNNPRLADVLEGIITGGPDGTFLEEERERRTGIGRLPPDKASGKTLTLISPDCLPDDERYAGPRPWAEIVAMERLANQRDLMFRNIHGLNPDPGLCRRCRRLGLIRTVANGDDGNVSKQFTDNQLIRLRPFGAWLQLQLRSHCSICRLVMYSLSCGTMYLHPLLREIDPEAQYSQLIPETLPSGENIVKVEYALRKFGILRTFTNENFRDVLRQAHEVDDVTCPFGKLQDLKSVFYSSNGQMISSKLMKNWINDCERLHGQSCNTLWTSSDSSDERPIFVIDVWNRCLIEKSVNEIRYVALSYVRGDTTIPITTLASLDQRKRTNSLPTDLPATLEDAIEAVKRLDECYLWVDALCIVQDDLNSKHSDIRRMHAIYSHAVVTIIALSGSDADAGLPGIRPGSRTPQLIECPPIGGIMPNMPDWLIEGIDRTAIEDPKQHQFRLDARHIGTVLTDMDDLMKYVHVENRNAELEAPGKHNRGRIDWGMVAHPPSLKHIISISPWNSRGWTLQERLLSRRCIYFSHDYVYFQCGKDTLSETGGSLFTWDDVEVHAGNAEEVERAAVTNPLLHFRDPSGTHTLKHVLHRATHQMDDFDCYTQLIEMYSKRDLSFKSDVVNAVTGMLQVLQAQLGNDMIAGTPLRYLDLIMMWTPAEPLDRTTPVGEGANPFPTWSWAAWTARKQFRLAHNDFGHDDPMREYATSEVDRFTICQNGEQIEIFKTPHELVATERIDISTAQDGSHKLEFPKYIPYTIRRVPNAPGFPPESNVLQFWAYATPAESFQFADIEGTLISEPEHGNQRGSQYVNSLLDPRRKHCGLLFKPQSRSSCRKASNVSSLEYILVSSFVDSVRRRDGIETIDPSAKPFDPHAFPWRGEGSGLVNLMLIEWFGDFAERLTVAQVNRQAWENARPAKKLIRLV